MPTMTRGPLSPVVYWRRRLVAGGVLLAFVLIVVNLVHGGGASAPSADQTAAQTAATTEPSAGASPGTDDRGTRPKHHVTSLGSTGTSGGPAQGPSQPTLVAPSGACDDHDVLVAPQVASAVSGSPAAITLSLRTKTTPACTWHVSASSLAIKISRFGNEIWSTRLCPNQLPITDVVVRQAVATTITVPWTTRRGEPGCPRLTAWAPTGHYRVDAAAIGGTPAGSGFELSPRTVVVAPPPSTETDPTKGRQRQRGTTGSGSQT